MKCFFRLLGGCLVFCGAAGSQRVWERGAAAALSGMWGLADAGFGERVL